MRRLSWRIDARIVDIVECVVSVLLAIGVAHLLNAPNVSWAAFSGYMVMRGHALETLQRGALRIIGTLVGGLLALAAFPVIASQLWLQAVVLAAVSCAGLYGALTARHGYAWLFFGLTFAMVVFDKIEHPAESLIAFVEARFLETTAGTIACVVVSLLSTLTLRRYWPAARAPVAQALGWHAEAFSHAAQCGVAMAGLAVLSSFYAAPALAQGAVTVIAVMFVPVSAVGANGLISVRRRIWQRFLGAGAGALLGAFFLFVARGHAPAMILGVVIGVAIGRAMENGALAHRYVGTQFTLAVLVTLVPDDYSAATIEPGLARLLSIFIGMAVLEPVLVAWRLLGIDKRLGDQSRGADELGGV